MKFVYIGNTRAAEIMGVKVSDNAKYITSSDDLDGW